jgi:taurine dioxygenase
VSTSTDTPPQHEHHISFMPGPRRLARTPEDWVDAPYSRLTLRPLSPTIGAEVGGVDLATLDDAQFAEVHRALLEWKVLFFRDQQIDADQHRAFAARFGPLEEHPFIAAGATADVVRFEKGEKMKGYENAWHTDVTWRECPALGAVLRAIEIPEMGGDTLFADMAAAFDNLPSATREQIDGLRAVHDFTPTFGAFLDAETRTEMQEKFPAVEHPVVRRHPETGRKTLFVNPIFTTHIVGMARDESRALLERLYAQAAIPEFQCRWSWRPNDVAMWDNRAVQHYACSDYAPARRVMERVAIVGDRPA